MSTNPNLILGGGIGHGGVQEAVEQGDGEWVFLVAALHPR